VVGVKRGDVVVANLDPTMGVEIKKTRPVIVLSNDSINQFSQLVVVVPLTKNTAHLSPSHAIIPKGVARLTFASKVVTEQIKAVDKRRLVKRLGSLTPARSLSRSSAPSRIPWHCCNSVSEFGLIDFLGNPKLVLSECERSRFT